MFKYQRKSQQMLPSRLSCQCDFCNKEMVIFRFQLSSKHYFCSQRCFGLWRSKNLIGKNNPMFGIKQNKKTKQKISKLKKLHWKQGKQINSLKTMFKKDHSPWNKNVSVRLNPKNEFPKGKNHPNFGKRGKETSSFKTGSHIDKCGYKKLLRPGHRESFKNGYVSEHRYKIANKLNRKLKKNEVVHHIDGNKSNNRLSNLLILSKAEHLKIHFSGYNYILVKGLIKDYLKWIKKNV